MQMFAIAQQLQMYAIEQNTHCVTTLTEVMENGATNIKDAARGQ
jgi:hypothetical protein